MQYLIIEETNTDNLAEEVNKKIIEGWRPQGGVSITLSESDEYQYYSAAQAMVREDV